MTALTLSAIQQFKRGNFPTNNSDFDLISRLVYRATHYAYGMFPKREAGMKAILEYAHYYDSHKDYPIAGCKLCPAA